MNIICYSEDNMKQGIVVCFFLFVLFFLLPTPTKAFYACGGSPCNGSYPCNGGLTCNGSSVCGTYYNTCAGATCNAQGGWDQASCNTPNQCTPSGTTRTATFGACGAACGAGTKTCNCGAENDCTATCAGGVACAATAACCTDQAPQTAPSALACAQVGVTRTAQVDWTFADTGSTCGQSWGYNCAGNSNTFQLRFNGGKSNENGLSTDRTLTTGVFPDWGTYTVQVCALNGVSENCSATTNCVLTAPTCSTSGQVDNTACRNTDPTLSATVGNGADEIEYLVKQGSSTLSNPYAAQSGWIVPADYVPSLSTNTYYWNTVARSTAAPVACITPAVFPTGYQLNIDKTAPSTPVGAFTGFVADPACLSQYFVTYGWGASSDVGCGGLVGSPYTSQISKDNLFAALEDNTNTAGLSITSAASYLPATTLYGRVKAVDGASNDSGWSVAATSVVVPQPSPFPTIHIQGNYVEDTGVCNNMTLDPNNLSVALNIVPATGVSSVCTKAGSSYGCDITIDNQTAVCAVDAHTVSLVASYAGYDALEWRVGNVCAGAPNPSISINAGTPPAAPIDANIYFDYGTQSWFKTSNTSFTSKTARNNIIPNAPTAFDSDDSVAPPNNTYLTLNEGGAVLYTDSGKKIDLGPNAVNGFSAHNWYSNTYDASATFTPTKFTDYMKSRKKYKTITDVTSIDADGIYYVAGDLTIANMAPFNSKKVLIVTDAGTVTISADMVPTSAAVAIVAKTIVINSAVTEVDAILIGNTVDIGASATKLKINGNLIQLTNTTPFTNSRVTANAQSPSLFIKFNQAAYLDLLPYLSISMYDWRQIQ